MALAETGADYVLREVDILHGAQFAPQYRQLNPNALVPTLVDGDLVLWESSAIVYYLAERHPELDLLPMAAPQRANVVRWLVWQPVNVMPCIRRLRELTVLLGPGARADPVALERAKAALRDRFVQVAQALGDREYLCGAFGAADIVMLPHLWYGVHEMHLTLPDELTAYIARLGARPAWQTVLAAAAASPIAPTPRA